MVPGSPPFGACVWWVIFHCLFQVFISGSTKEKKKMGQFGGQNYKRSS